MKKKSGFIIDDKIFIKRKKRYKNFIYITCYDFSVSERKIWK